MTLTEEPKTQGALFPCGVARNQKDRVFRMLYNNKKHFLELYNAMNGICYEDEGELTVATLENAVYLSLKNDVSYLLMDELVLYEHQSTVNPNMPLRDLFYITRQLSVYTDSGNLYGKGKIWIPEPRFVVFYNGSEDIPERSVLKLSDMYLKHSGEPQLELKVEVFNINEGYNEELKQACPSLKEYMEYVNKVRSYSRILLYPEAVQCAVDDCIRQGILADFLRKNRAEVIEMSIFEYDEKRVLEMTRAEGREEGREEGRAASVLTLLERLGEVPERLCEEIMKEKREEKLKAWLFLAAGAESVEQFILQGKFSVQ